MRVNLDQLNTFSQCTQYYYFESQQSKYNLVTRNDVIKKIIQKTYQKQSEVDYIIPWRTISNWANNELFKHIDITIPNTYDRIKELTESIITPLNTWYFDFFKKEKKYGLINVPVSTVLNGVEIYDIVPIIKNTTPIQLITINEYLPNEIELYNNFYDRGLLYLVAKNLNEDKMKLEHYAIGRDSKFQRTILKTNKEMNERMEQRLSHLAVSIKLGLKYPSFTSMCNSCTFRTNCVL